MQDVILATISARTFHRKEIGYAFQHTNQGIIAIT
jgi:hypothetical protein